MRSGVATGCCLLFIATVSAVPLPRSLERRVKEGPIRVLVVDMTPENMGSYQKGIINRLTEIGFKVVALRWSKLDPDQVKDIDVILLPTQWAEDEGHFKHLELQKDAFHRFVRAGGGLLVCQPNPTTRGKCTSTLLPYPITFQNGYDDRDKTRLNLALDHFITENLPGDDMPFPADPMIEVDPRYRILARQKSTQFPSLAVCAFGDGRVVVQTANENRGSSIPLSDEILRRMVVWAAGREGAKR